MKQDLDPMSPEVIRKVLTPEFESLLEDLLQGITQPELDRKIGLLSTRQPPDLLRMNLLGYNLRSSGYLVTGGPRDRFSPYRIVGFQPKRDTPQLPQWPPEAQEVIQWVTTTFEQVTLKHEPQITELLRKAKLSFHESCWLYLWAYELADGKGGRGYYYQDSEIECVIIKRFPWVPRLRIYYLGGPLEGLRPLVTKLGQASLAPVSIINVGPPHVAAWKKFDPRAESSSHISSVIELDRFVNRPREILSSTEWARVRKLRSEITVTPTSTVDVITEWRRLNESKQRQLAVVRDYRAIEAPRTESALHFTYHWRGSPVATYVCEVLPGETISVAELVGKAINYPPLGQSGMSTATLYMLCEELLSLGAVWLNRGGYDGGESSLRRYKLKFSLREHDSSSRGIIPSKEQFPHLTREALWRFQDEQR